MDTSSTRSSTPASFDAALSVINLQPDSPVNSPMNALPSRRCPERFIDGKTWQLLKQQANIRRGSPISPIWEHGAEYFDIDRTRETSSLDLQLLRRICHFTVDAKHFKCLKALKKGSFINAKATDK